ncbi:MAG: type II 3-dehydroquinate dehydratase [Chloroflexi bacterium]|nr:MAG: type II 3-dehydroquinate dehydratase [Chloroflexota bacterium]TME46471.1 MAG: type II 3-dehydroquinate dehydratase [Chloroflexota bacterium]
MKVLVLNGPNLATLGRREPEIYGSATLAELEALLGDRAKTMGIEVQCLQSNHEGGLIDAIENAAASVDAIVINPGALSHYSLALADALRGSGKPVIEVHISNVFARQPERHRMVTAAAAKGVISGLGFDGYLAALAYLSGRSPNA